MWSPAGGHKGRPYKCAEWKVWQRKTGQCPAPTGACRRRPLVGADVGIGPYTGEPSAGGGQARPYVQAPSSGFLPYRPVRRGRYGVSPRRRCAIGRTTWGRFQRWGPGGPLFGRFKGDGCREGGKSKSPLPGRLFRPFLSAQKGARRRHDKETGVKKGNMEGAPAWHKAGRCGQKVNCPRGAREAALGRRPLRNRPVPRYHGVGATLVVAPRAAIKAAPTGPGYRQTSRRSVRPISQSTDTP